MIYEINTTLEVYQFVEREFLLSVFAFCVSNAVWFTLYAPEGAPFKTGKMRPSWSSPLELPLVDKMRLQM